MKTWHLELLAVACALGAVWCYSGGGKVEAIGSLAVLAGFAHGQVADRLAEAARFTERTTELMTGADLGLAHCWRWARRYYITKEALWLVYFVNLRAWSALAGVFIFLAYPAWRWTYRRL